MALAAIAAASAATAVHAQTIKGVTGDVSHGNVVTLSGDGFGEKVPAAPIRYDDFEDGVLGTTVEGWLQQYTQYSEAHRRNPGVAERSAAWDMTLDASGHLRMEASEFPPEHLENQSPPWFREFYVSGYRYVERHAEVLRNIKPFAVRGGDEPGRDVEEPKLRHAQQEWCDLDKNSFIYRQDCYKDSDCHDYLSPTVISPNPGWIRFEAYAIDTDVDGGDTFFLRIDEEEVARTTPGCELVGDISGPECDASQGGSGSLWSELYFFHYADHRKECPDDDGKLLAVFWDELYVDGTRKRVELCDEPSWGSRGHCEIQIPRSWSPEAIDVRINQGRFDEGQRVYFYVIDQDGNPSGSYEVTIGSSGGGSDTRPDAPEDLRRTDTTGP